MKNLLNMIRYSDLVQIKLPYARAVLEAYSGALMLTLVMGVIPIMMLFLVDDFGPSIVAFSVWIFSQCSIWSYERHSTKGHEYLKEKLDPRK